MGSECTVARRVTAGRTAVTCSRGSGAGRRTITGREAGLHARAMKDVMPVSTMILILMAAVSVTARTVDAVVVAKTS